MKFGNVLVLYISLRSVHSQNILNDYKFEGKLIRPDIGAIMKNAFYATVVLCTDKQLVNWDCKYCKKIDFNQTRFVGSYENARNTSRAILAINDVHKGIIVSYRGTANLDNKISDIDLFTTPYDEYISQSDVRVHDGFRGIAVELTDMVRIAIQGILNQPLYSDYKIILTGHSMGGALATLGIIKLNMDLDLDWSRFELFTYNMSRTGNRQFGEWLSSQPLKAARGTYFNDEVPHIYGDFLIEKFGHYQNEVFISNERNNETVFCNNDYLEDPKCSNSVDKKLYNSTAHLIFLDTRFNSSLSC